MRCRYGCSAVAARAAILHSLRTADAYARVNCIAAALRPGSRKPTIEIHANATKRVRKAVFPVAGLGTRFLPATKAMPKEMLTVVDRPGDPARGRRGQGRRHRAFHLRHRPQQGRHRGPFRQPVRARAHAGGARQDEGARAAHGRAAAAPARRASRASRRRSASAMRCGARATSSATSRSRCCFPTCCTSAPKPCLAEMIEAYDDARRQPHRRRAGARGPDAPLRHRRRRGQEGQGLAHHRHGREAEAGRRRRPTCTSPAATSCSRRSSPSSSAASAAPAARSSSPTP